MFAVNQFQQTNYPNIFACGDVSGPFQFTHVAAHQAWYATVNALFGDFKKFSHRLFGDSLGHVIDPEVARVGLTSRRQPNKA